MTTAPLRSVVSASTALSTSWPRNTQSCRGMPSSPRPALGPAFGAVTNPSRLIVMSAVTLFMVSLLRHELRRPSYPGLIALSLAPGRGAEDDKQQIGCICREAVRGQPTSHAVDKRVDYVRF